MTASGKIQLIEYLIDEEIITIDEARILLMNTDRWDFSDNLATKEEADNMWNILKNSNSFGLDVEVVE